MTAEKPVLLDALGEDEEIESDEYFVEAIRAKRRNPKTGLTEYFIKWQGYPESDNNWEPIDNLKCPDLILKFEEKEKEKSKRKRTSAVNRESQTTKKAKKEEEEVIDEPLLVEDQATETNTETTAEIVAPPVQLKGFNRGLPIEQIVAACFDDVERMWFFIKWEGLQELELVDASEVEEKSPRQLCNWYRERMYYTIKLGEEERTVQKSRAQTN